MNCPFRPPILSVKPCRIIYHRREHLCFSARVTYCSLVVQRAISNPSRVFLLGVLLTPVRRNARICLIVAANFLTITVDLPGRRLGRRGGRRVLVRQWT
jgi:hypothetical protein